MRLAAIVLQMGWLLFAQSAPDPNLRTAIRDAVQQARALRKTQEAISAALAANQASRALLKEHIASTEKTLQLLRASIDKIDEQYESLSEARQSAVRDAWSTLKLFDVLFEYLKETAAKPDSIERERDLISHAVSTARRAVQLDETLTLLTRPT